MRIHVFSFASLFYPLFMGHGVTDTREMSAVSRPAIVAALRTPTGGADSPATSITSTRSPRSARVLRFASAVAVSGNDILVGRPGPSARVTAPFGGVHVFRRHSRSGPWVERLVLAPADVRPDEDFGATLAADGRWLAVGAPRARHGRGAVYLFERTASGHWIQRARLRATTGMPNEQFGAALALKGAVLVVGAPMYAEQRGRAVVFRRGANGRWTEQAVLTSADTSHMGFGQALALTADEVLVGAAGPLQLRLANGQEQARDAAPRVFIFGTAGWRWVPGAQLVSPDGAAASAAAGPSAFGRALVTNGADLWVADPLAAGSGAVVQFHRAAAGHGTSHWTLVGSLTPRARNGDFGTALAYDGTDLLVGAYGSEAAAVHIFRAPANVAPRAGAASAAVSIWTEADRLVLGDGRAAGPRFAPRPQWFPGTLALAAAHGVTVIGVAWGNELNGWGLALQRQRRPREIAVGPTEPVPAPDASWRLASTLTDTAWSTQAPLSGAVRPCQHGHVQVFRCDHVDLFAFVPITALGPAVPTDTASGHSRAIEVSGLWGWSDSATGREFALVGRTDGTSFVEVTDPTHPRVLGVLPIPDSATPSLWRDIKVYQNYALIVSDMAGPHGLQIFDLTRLRSVTNAPVVFTATARYTGIASAHTLILNSATGYAYSAGNNGGGESCGGGLHMLDVHTPTAPVFIGCYAEPKAGGQSDATYIHDAQCVVYQGPDTLYRGHEICLNFSGGALGLADVTDKKHPTTISVARYPNLGYVHQGWLTEDQRYVFVDDEFDERAQLSTGQDPARVRTRTLVFDLRTLADPVLVTEFLGTTGATDHNLYIRGRYMYQSNYTAGLRVIDVADPRQPNEVGYFDTAPAYDDTPRRDMPRTSQGTWTNYPYLRSGAVAVTSMSEGLYLVRFRAAAQP